MENTRQRRRGFFGLRSDCPVRGGNQFLIKSQLWRGVLCCAVALVAAGCGSDNSTAPVRSANISALQNAGLYGTVRLRTPGVTSTNASVAVTIGGVASPTVNVGYTDANAPAATASQGGAIDFVVPSGLSAGTQTLSVTVNGTKLADSSVTITDTDPYAVFTIDTGKTFVAVLRADAAPNTVANFVGLATGSKTYTNPCTGTSSNARLYNGTTFHRVINNFVSQGGDPLTKCPGTNATGSIATIPFEDSHLTHVQGALGVARSSALDSASSQFFIDRVALDGTIAGNANLNITRDANGNATGGYVVFGKVIEGFDNANTITINKNSDESDIAGITSTTLTSVVITGNLGSKTY